MMGAGSHFFSSKKVRRIIVFLIIAVLASLFAVYVLWQTQRSSWTTGWVYVGMLVAANIINLVLMGKWNPGLIERRMVVNPFFEKSVRIQTEHAHRVAVSMN